MKKSFRVLASLVMLLVVVIAVAACSNNSKYEKAMTNVSLLLDNTWDSNEKFDDNNNSLGSFVTSDFTVPYEVNVDGEVIAVAYSVSGSENAKVNKDDATKTVTIEVSQTGEVQKFTLTVSIEKVEAKSWEFNIEALDLSMEKTQAEIDAMNPIDYATYAAKKSGDSVVVQGWITHAHDYSSSYGNASVWLQDDNGGYYAYRVKVASQREWDEYFKVGNKIAISGKVSPYSGWQEIGSGCKYYYIKDAETKTFDFVDITSVWGAAEPKDAAATAYQNQKVKVTAKVASVPEYNAEDMFMDITVNGHTGYTVYFKDAYMSWDNSFLSDLQVGYTIEISGIAAVGSEKAQLCPISADCYTVTSTEVTNQDRVDAAIAEVGRQNIASSYYASLKEPIELITSYKAVGDINVPITYELKVEAGTGISLTDNKLMVEVDPTTASKATLTATATLDGAEERTQTFNIVTKTNKDVVEEEIDALLGESYPSMISSENILNRIRLYKSDRATITYELKNADDAQYVKIGQYSSGVYYVEVNDTTFPSVTTQITVVATVAYGTGENVVEETAEISFLCIDSVDNLTEFDSYYYAADGANVSFSGVVTYASYTKPMALVQGDGGAVYVYFKTSNVTEDEFKSLFVIGNKVSLKGTKDIFNGLNEFVVAKASDVKVEANAQTLPAYTDITSLVQEGADLSRYQGMLVEVKNATYTSSGFKVGDNTLAYYKDGKILSANLATELKANNVYNIKGFINWYNKQQITPISADAATLVSEAAPVVSDADATMKYEGSTTINMDGETNNAETVNLDPSIFNVTASKGSASNLPGLNKAGQIRLYNAADGNGSEFTVAVTGKTIAKIVVHFLGNKEATATITGRAENVALSSSDQTITVEYATAVSQFTIKNNTASSGSAQVWISYIEIYYAE